MLGQSFCFGSAMRPPPSNHPLQASADADPSEHAREIADHCYADAHTLLSVG
jgi:hypothetical protein